MHSTPSRPRPRTSSTRSSRRSRPLSTLWDKAIEEYGILREKAEAAFNKLKDAAKAELIVVKDELQKVYSKVKDVAGQQMNAAMDVILEAVRPTVHKYVPPVIAVAGLTAFVAVSEIPLKMLGPIMGNLFSWTIFPAVPVRGLLHVAVHGRSPGRRREVHGRTGS